MRLGQLLEFIELKGRFYYFKIVNIRLRNKKETEIRYSKIILKEITAI